MSVPRPGSGRSEPLTLEPPAGRSQGRTLVIIVAVLLAAAAVYWLARGVAGELAARALSIFVIAAGFWALEVIPLFATAFVVIGLQILFLASDGGFADWLTLLLHAMGLPPGAPSERAPINATAFLTPLGSDIIVLFMGGFLLAAAIRRHGVDRAIANRLLRPFTAAPRRLLYVVLGVSAFFSMWMSNTATAAMMTASVGPVLRLVPERERFRLGLLLAVAFGANIGGIGTPIGTPPNAIAYGALQHAGYDLTFLRWMMVAVPLELLLLGIVGLLLLAFFPPPPALEAAAIEPPQRLTREGRLTLVVLAAAVFMWLTSGVHGMSPGAVALLAAASLTAFGVLGRHDVDSIDWNVLILMWGALSLAVGAEQSGLTRWVGRLDFEALPGGAWVAGAGFAFLAMGVSTVMSNTATAALLVPVALALSTPDSHQFVMLAALACSFAMAMPVSTPPNTIAYATGDVPLPAMLRTGGLISVIAVVILLAGYRIVLPLVF